MSEIKNKIAIVVLMVIAAFAMVGVAYAKKSREARNQISGTPLMETNDASGVSEQSEETISTVSEVAQDMQVQNKSMDSAVAAPAAVDAIPYPVHKNIATTYFWAGEEAGPDNRSISNLPSAWDEEWVKNFGGVDSPIKRTGYMPGGFVPKENPFYFALPYNDFAENGKRKSQAYAIIPWAKKRAWAENESMLKNQWVKITKNGKSAYAQWEDVGPFGEDDATYVFGSAAPKNKINGNAGLDVSPAVKDYLVLSDEDRTDWQFVDADQVPEGPWKMIVTNS